MRFLSKIALVIAIAGCGGESLPPARDAAVPDAASHDFAVADFAVADDLDVAAPDLGAGAWTELNIGPLPTLAKVWGTSKDDIFLLGGGIGAGVILHTTNGGQKWDIKTIPGVPGFSSGFGSIAGTSNVIYIGGDNEPIFHSTDDGKTWVQENSQAVRDPFSITIWGTDLWATGGQAEVAHATTASPDWTAVPGPKDGGTLYGALANANGLYVAGTSGLFFTADGGTTWELQNQSLDVDAFWSSGPTDLFVVGDHGVIFHSSDGKTWQSQYADDNIGLHAVWGSDPMNVWAVGEIDNGPNSGVSIILRTSDGGQKWTVEAMPPRQVIWSIWGSGPDDIYAVGDDPFVNNGAQGGFILHHG